MFDKPEFPRTLIYFENDDAVVAAIGAVEETP
jgi:hypothetical protein